jgi:flagellar biosynthesis protein FlhB
VVAEQDQNRSEEATPFKREEARKKGSVAKSLDVNSFGILAIALIGFYIFGARIYTQELSLFASIFQDIPNAVFGVDPMATLLSSYLKASIMVLAPFLALLVVGGALINFFQIGPIFSWVPLKPDLNRINPIAGFKRLFSMKMLFEAIKTVLKFVILGVVFFFVFSGMLPEFFWIQNVMARQAGAAMFAMVSSVWLKLLIAFAFIALLDLILSRWDYSKRLRMSRRDITDEHKRREGDPRVKSRIRELQREALKRAKSLGRVKEADVLITNPTHLAIAIKFDQSIMSVPVVLAKGAGFMAERMKDIARLHGVPVIEQRLLARTLFKEAVIDGHIPVSQYADIAKILFWVSQLKKSAAVQ